MTPCADLFSATYEEVMERCHSTENPADIVPMLLRLCDLVDSISDEQLIRGIKTVTAKRSEMFGLNT